ncbi:hypothetical protein [Bacillus paramobilis]|uniref:hypothetical protein n=1 Tax=Bacillus paramobilis TaxID=2817477 RepID=UPI0032163A2C
MKKREPFIGSLFICDKNMNKTPPTGKNSAYQIVIINDILTADEYKEEVDDALNKAELEKIIISYLK